MPRGWRPPSSSRGSEARQGGQPGLDRAVPEGQRREKRCQDIEKNHKDQLPCQYICKAANWKFVQFKLPKVPIDPRNKIILSANSNYGSSEESVAPIGTFAWTKVGLYHISFHLEPTFDPFHPLLRIGPRDGLLFRAGGAALGAHRGSHHTKGTNEKKERVIFYSRTNGIGNFAKQKLFRQNGCGDGMHFLYIVVYRTY